VLTARSSRSYFKVGHTGVGPQTETADALVLSAPIDHSVHDDVGEANVVVGDVVAESLWPDMDAVGSFVWQHDPVRASRSTMSHVRRRSQMSFPNLDDPRWGSKSAGPYERHMGRLIRSLLTMFSAHAIDTESNAALTAMATSTTTWNAAHAVFDEVRGRLLQVTDDEALTAQYFFEECCAKAMFNATDTNMPFDAASAFFVVPAAHTFAIAVGLGAERVATALEA
jgi:hypothetical protein